MTAANDNRHARKKRVRSEAARSVATMTRIIHDIYGAPGARPGNVGDAPELAPGSMADSWEPAAATPASASNDKLAH
jgi:hypothetical protein